MSNRLAHISYRGTSFVGEVIPAPFDLLQVIAPDDLNDCITFNHVPPLRERGKRTFIIQRRYADIGEMEFYYVD